MESLQAGALLVLAAVGLLAAPAALASLLLHWSERRMTGGLMRLAGRRAVLITGWLGVPIHELSHALFCVIFRHRIDRIVLFHPDPKTGTLGYVMHAWDRRNPWQVAGNFFIGIAPLLGGAAVLLLLHRLLLPGALVVPDLPLPASPGDAAGWAALGRSLGEAFRASLLATFAPAHLGSWQLWVFLYLAFCVGSHLSPSPEDVRGGLWGGLACFALLVLAGAVAVAAGHGQALLRGALVAGLAVGIPLAFVLVVNLPLALAVSTLGRVRTG